MGMGLMGGSLGLGLRAAGTGIRVVGYARRPETRDYALARGMADAMHADPRDAVRGSRWVVMCVPVLSTEPLVRACLPALAPGGIVTDVGSTKAALAARLGPLVAAAGGIFIGSHPIAGSERGGVESARQGLYRGAVVAVTPADEQAGGEATGALCRFWEQLGARAVVMSPEAHDRVLARTSHLPHLIAAVLAAAVGREGAGGQTAAFCGSGFRDATRIAEGSPRLWLDILATNRQNIGQELAAFADLLERVRAHLADGADEAIEAFLEQAKETRMELMGNAEPEA